MHPKAARAAVLFVCFLFLFLIIDDSRTDLESLPPPSSPASSEVASPKPSSPASPSHPASPQSQPVVGSQYWQLFKPGTFGGLSAPCNETRSKMCKVSETCGVFAFDPSNANTLFEQCPNVKQATVGERPTCCRNVSMLQEPFPTDTNIDDLFNLLLNKVHATPSRTPAVTFMGDSTWQDLFQQLHRYLCIKPGSSRFNCSSPAPEAPMFTHTFHEIPATCKLQQPTTKNWWTSALETKLLPMSFSVRDSRNNRSLFAQFFPFQSVWGSNAHLDKAKKAEDKARVKCVKDVLTHFDSFSDGILFNLGLHYHESDKERYKKSLDLLLEEFAAMLSKPSARLQFAIPFETLPTHFAMPAQAEASHTWGECLQNASSLPAANSELARLSSEALPPGLFSFPCGLHAADNWRNDMLHKEAKPLGFKVGQFYNYLAPRCDLHTGSHGDCLHYDSLRHPEFFYNLTVHAFQTALTQDSQANAN